MLVPKEFRSQSSGTPAYEERTIARGPSAPQHSEAYAHPARLLEGPGANPSAPEKVAAATNSLVEGGVGYL